MRKVKQFFQFNIRFWVFWPSFILLILAVLFSILFPDSFINFVEQIQQALLSNFSLGFSWVSFAMTIIVLVTFFLPIGNRRIGGEHAQPRLPRLSWFAIVLCTTIAVGILFWGSAEPLSHFLFPPEFKNLEGKSVAAADFSLGALFFHWGFTPYAIYVVPALTFSLFFYQNKNKPSISLAARPLLGSNLNKRWENIIDGISLFSLVAGMAGALGAGILSLSGGFLKLFPDWNMGILSGVITLVILLTFVISSSTGIERGIKNLSLINLFFFILIALLFVFLGEGGKILSSLKMGFIEYGKNFFDLSLQWNGAGSSWTYDWSVFNFAMWMAWAPVTAIFLGKIAYGRTIREFLIFNWFLPVLFCLIWMGVFGGTTLDLAILKPEFYQNLFQTSGPESIIYQVFEDLGYFKLFSYLFILAIFISYVTAADSSTDALASLSMKKINKDPFQSDTNLKIIWGTLIAFLAWIMILFSGIDGVRILSVIAGVPALFFLLIVTVSLFLLVLNPKKYLGD
ncbi:BCCT family transporter [Algoriphagus lutimaris]|uniref:BCCT family transporter n=1 Tax=Algoriphagus lutimaris TaxID=613197 RepID=UPI00196B0204|nr:BCCT family transporter [Algoriphagus lutimaris]MBN3519148.1 BCCT family transporter [Algoriphagus lutimaris]